MDKVPANRLGGSFNKLKNHQFFGSFDWRSLINKKMDPGFSFKTENENEKDRIKLQNMTCRSIQHFLKEYNKLVIKRKDLTAEWDSIYSE